MKISDLVSLSFENLRRRKGRTVLTVIGVVIGTCAIVVMVSLGIAMNEGFDEMLAQWGDLTQIQVYLQGSSGSSEALKLDDAAITTFSELENVTVATPIYTSPYLNIKVVAGKKDRYQMQYAQIVGVYAKAIEALEYELISGEYLPEKAASESGKVQVLIGENAGYSFYDTKRKGDKAYRWQGQTDAAGELLEPFVNISSDVMTIHNASTEKDAKPFDYDMNVVGVLKSDYSKGYYTDGGIIMDLNVLKRLEKEYIKANAIKDTNADSYNQVIVKATDVDTVEAVEQAIKDMGYGTYSMSSQRESMQQQSQMIQMVLGGLGAVSLFVAALSIANTMTMAIYERTREIGVMKVLGCELGKIRSMFLFEAAMIGLIGGLAGIAISYVLSFVLNYFGPRLMASGLLNFLSMYGSYGSKLSVIPIWLSVSAVIFATFIGVVSGIAPANRAVRISALEAIRHE